MRMVDSPKVWGHSSSSSVYAQRRTPNKILKRRGKINSGLCRTLYCQLSCIHSFGPSGHFGTCMVHNSIHSTGPNRFSNWSSQFQLVVFIYDPSQSVAFISVRSTEYKRVSAWTITNVGEHFARAKAAMTRFGTTETSRVFYINESGISFKTILNRILCKEVGRAGKNCSLQQSRREASWTT